MIKKIQVTTDKAPLPLAGAYSQGLVINDNRMYVSGQGPVDVSTGKMPEGIAAQTTQVLENIRFILLPFLFPIKLCFYLCKTFLIKFPVV